MGGIGVEKVPIKALKPTFLKRVFLIRIQPACGGRRLEWGVGCLNGSLPDLCLDTCYSCRARKVSCHGLFWGSGLGLENTTKELGFSQCPWPSFKCSPSDSLFFYHSLFSFFCNILTIRVLLDDPHWIVCASLGDRWGWSLRSFCGEELFYSDDMHHCQCLCLAYWDLKSFSKNIQFDDNTKK